MLATSPTPRQSYRNGRLNCPAGAGAAPLRARNFAARNHSSTPWGLTEQFKASVSSAIRWVDLREETGIGGMPQG